MNNSKFDFYEIVTVKSNKKKLSAINGKQGVITGKSQSEYDPSTFAYGIDILDETGKIDEEEYAWFVFEEDLSHTGKKFNQENLYTGKTVKVGVDQKTGKGYLIDD